MRLQHKEGEPSPSFQILTSKRLAMKKELQPCPVGLEAIIMKVAEIMKESIGKQSMEISLSRADNVQCPWLRIYVHDERKGVRKKKKCDSFKFDSVDDPYYDKKINDKEWNKMLEYLEKVKL